MQALLKKVLFFIGYISLIGPPRAILIKARADVTPGELAGKPLWFVMLVEFILRGGIFLLLAVSLESMVGKHLYELYQLDLFLGALIVSGLLHSLFYYLGFGLRKGQLQSSARIYRLGRNFAYAVIPAFVAAGITLAWQNINQLALFEGHQVQQAFLLTWIIFLLIGLLEAIFATRHPTGLSGSIASEPRN